MKKLFEGELMKINPYLLIHENGDDKLGSFFLCLGTIFNDLKDVVLFQELLKDNYENPKDSDVTAHVGNYGGVVLHIQKLLAGVIWEFFEFLKNNKQVLSSSEFRIIFQKLPKYHQNFWEQLIDASNNKLSNVTDLLKSIVQIRSNIAFHYDHSGKKLLNGYRSRFFSNIKDCRNDFAYYSIGDGDTVKFTRFYFSDAAIEEALYVMAGKKYGENIKDNEQSIKYQGQIGETIAVISSSIVSLINNFIKFRRNHPIATGAVIKT